MNTKTKFGKIVSILAAFSTFSAAAAMYTLSASAYTHQAGIFGVTNQTGIVVESGATVELAGDEGGDDKSPYAYVMNIPGSAPGAGGIDTALEQNGTLWSAVDDVEVDFTVTNQSPDAAEMEYFYIQGFLTLGEDANWEYYDSGNTPDIVSISPETTEGEAPSFDTKYTVTFHPSAAMTEMGVDANSKGGVSAMGLMFGNDDVEDMKFDIKFTDVRIKGDSTVIAKYTKLASELTKGQGSNEIPAPAGTVTEATVAGGGEDASGNGGANEITDGTGEGAKLPEGNKTGASTGAADVAIVIAIAAVAGGALVITRKKQK